MSFPFSTNEIKQKFLWNLRFSYDLTKNEKSPNTDPDLKTYEIHKEMALQEVMQCTEFVLSRNHSTLDYFIL